MVAYSFKRQFVDPIKVGLGLRGSELARPIVHPKRQTIRADRKRHARPGEELQLYCGMRTRHCFLIGRARCLSVKPLALLWGVSDAMVYIENEGSPLTPEFARADGFESPEAMRAFWEAEHGEETFRGVLIQWEPL